MHSHTHREQNIKTAVFLNVLFTIIEIIGGLWTNSLAILSDALHDLGDSVALGASWFAERKSRRPPDKKRTFGYQRFSLFAALFTATVLVSGSLFIISKTIPRLFNPQPVHAPGMIGLAIIGILFNGAGFLKLKGGMSMNEKVLSWHLLEDVFGWIVILVGSIAIQLWGNYLIDPIMTLGFTAFTLWGVTKNLKETFNIFLQGVPKHIDIEAIKKELTSIKEVEEIHDVHIWSLEGETNIFTGHIVVKDPFLKDFYQIKKKIKGLLKKHHINHSTLEIEAQGSCSGVECEQAL